MGWGAPGSLLNSFSTECEIPCEINELSTPPGAPVRRDPSADLPLSAFIFIAEAAAAGDARRDTARLRHCVTKGGEIQQDEWAQRLISQI